MTQQSANNAAAPVAAVNPNLITPEIRDAYDAATGEWSGCDWAQHFAYQIPRSDEESEEEDRYIDADTLLTGDEDIDQLVSEHPDGESTRDAYTEALAYVRQCRDDAEAAEDEAAAAMEALKTGDLESAISHIQQASHLESEYGDDPTWSTLRKRIEALAEEKEIA